MSIHELTIIITLLMLFCVFASRYLTYFGVPILVFFIGIGMILGSEGIFGIHFDNPFLTREIGNIALCFIIFSGGMDLRWRSAKPIISSGLLLSTVSVFLTAFLVGVVTSFILGIPLLYGLLLGAIVSSTDAAAVFSVFRTQKSRLKSKVASLLEFESGSNDPMAYMLTITMLGIITNPQDSVLNYILLFVKQFGFGAIIGIALGFITVQMLNRMRLSVEGMYLIVGISLLLFTYSIASLIGGNGFLAVYIAGFIIGNTSFIQKTRFVHFFEVQSWIAQIILFVTLGLQVFPSQLVPVMISGIIISLILIFIIRPIAVMPILSLFKIPIKEQLFVSLVGFRGAASIVFATYPLTVGLPFAHEIFNMVFFIALTSVLFQGINLKPLAKHLGVIEKEDDKPIMQTFSQYMDELSDMPILGVYVLSDSPAIGKRISELGLPHHIRIVAIKQADHYVAPKGQTLINAGDRMLLTSLEDDNLNEVCEKFKFES